MLKHLFAALSLALVALTFAGVAAAQEPLVNVCVAGTTAPSCNGYTVCAWFASGPPACVLAPVCIGYDMCAPCHEGYAWIGVENPLKGTWTCGQCEACGNPIV